MVYLLKMVIFHSYVNVYRRVSIVLVDFVSGISAIHFLIFCPLKHLLNHEYLKKIQSFSIENTFWIMNISGYPYIFICFFPLKHFLLIDEYLEKNIFFHENTCWLMNIMRISSFFPWKYVLNGWSYQTLLVSLLPVHLHV